MSRYIIAVCPYECVAKGCSMKSEFGKDLGLIHEAVIAGREVGADWAFWASLAHEPKLFEQVVLEVKQAQLPNSSDKKLIEDWLARMASEWPFCEKQSYYSRSSHCGYERSMRALPSNFPALFLHAQHCEESRVLAAAIECHFILCYIYSAVHAARFYGNKAWFHPPLEGLYRTFDDLVEGEVKTSRGQFLPHKHFLANESVGRVRDIASRYRNRWDEGLHSAELNEMMQACDTARENQHLRIIGLLEQVT